LLLLYFLIPAARLGSLKRYWLFFAGLVVIALAGGITWELIINGLLKADSPIIILARQLIEHPRQAGNVITRGMGAPFPLLTKVIGGPLVTDVLNIGFLVAIAYALLMLIVALLDFAPNAGRVALSNRLIPWASAALSLVTITLLMYLTWPYAYYAQGIHPRHIVPLSFVALLFFLNAMPRVGKLGRFAREHFGSLATLYFILRLGETLWAVNQRYYALGT